MTSNYPRSWMLKRIVIGGLLAGVVGAEAPPELPPDEPAALVPDYTTEQILRRADEARGNLEGVRWTVDIDAKDQGRPLEYSLDVRSRGYDFLATYLAPPRSRGQRILFVDRNMWYAKPGVRKPVPVSARQTLAGGAAYGDIAATNFSEDYDAERLDDEIIDGILCYVFDLKAKNRRVTYDRVHYWVSQERHVAVQADYYTVSGIQLKRARFDFDHDVDIHETPRPFISAITIVDEVVDSTVTVMRFSSPRIESLPDSTFDINLLMTR